MKTIPSLSWIFPLTVFGAAATSIKYFDVVFTPTMRWFLLAGLALFLLARAKLLLSLRVSLAPIVILWAGWAIVTVLWSDVPLLSGLKGIALAMSTLSLLSGGVFWAQYARPGDPLIYLAPLTALALLTAVSGLGTFRHVSGVAPLFEGISENVNAFAIIIAMGLPYPLHAAFRASARAEWARLGLWSCVTILLLIAVVMTRSRASMGASGCILLCFAVVVIPRKTLLAAAAVTVALFAAAILTPQLSARLVEPVSHFLAKGHDEDPLFTRRDAWRISYEHAKTGGLIGLGLGVSDDTQARFEIDSSATAYGREKGSSQLAIVEETGLIGLAIYGFLLWRVFSTLVSRTTALAERDMRAAAVLAIGALAGLVVQSVFEAWWTSPGSFEAVVFWSTLGVVVGIQRRLQPADGAHAPQFTVLGARLAAGQ